MKPTAVVTLWGTVQDMLKRIQKTINNMREGAFA